jgi:hypothetical protein
MVTAIKFMDFFTLAGNSIKLRLPELVFAFCFVGGIFGLLEGIIGFFAWRGVMEQDVWIMFEFWPLCCALTCCIFMGLYFKEVSSLTSAKDIVGFGSLNYVAIPVVSLLWIVNIILGVMQAADPTGVAGVGSNTYIAFIAFVSLASAVALAICLWGSISIAMSLNGVDSGRVFTLVLTIISSLVATCLSVSTGLCTIIIQTYPNNFAIGLTSFDTVTRLELLPNFTQMLAMLLLISNFRVASAKEIELSKSATSSTSGGSSASSASSSSKSGADPVIEL